MSEQRKKLLALLGSVFILCSCCGGLSIWAGGTFSQVTVTEPKQVQKIGQEIAIYTVPESYAEILGFNFMGTKTIAMAHEDLATDTFIFMMQVPHAEGVSEAEVENQLLAMLQRFNPSLLR